MTIQLCDVCGKMIQGEMDLVYAEITPAVSFGTRKTKNFDLCGCCARQTMLFLMKNEKPQEMSETLQ